MKINIDGTPNEIADLLMVAGNRLYDERQKRVAEGVYKIGDAVLNAVRHEPPSSEQTGSVLSWLPTHELVDELTRREGVEEKVAEPYKDMTVTVNGPARILIVSD